MGEVLVTIVASSCAWGVGAGGGVGTAFCPQRIRHQTSDMWYDRGRYQKLPTVRAVMSLG